MLSKNKQTVPAGTVFRAHHTGSFVGSMKLIDVLLIYPSRGEVSKSRVTFAVQCS